LNLATKALMLISFIK